VLEELNLKIVAGIQELYYTLDDSKV